jgi:methylenetetrahydrofolate dehydrogenase (NADP+) / methenyltetrahydrofolate cyclohydrolase
MILLSGTIVRDKIKAELADAVSLLPYVPELAIVQVGDNAESSIYIGQKKRFGEAVGIPVRHVALPAEATEEDLLRRILALNADISVGGIIVQLPLPAHMDARHVLDAIHPSKDVDGLGTQQIGSFHAGNPHALVPATARGIMSILDFYEVSLVGKHVVVVGRSDLVGKPVAMLCLRRNATVTICHSRTESLADITRTADVLIVAAGVQGLITREHVREGQVVVDVGIHRTEGGLRGDVDFDAVKDIVSAITPVPGGVGPLTVTSLFQNFLETLSN